MTDCPDIDFEKRLLAAAVYELRVLLSGYIDPHEAGPATDAALFAYALHNQALSALEGEPFDLALALEAVERLEPRLGQAHLQHFRKVVLNEA